MKTETLKKIEDLKSAIEKIQETQKKIWDLEKSLVNQMRECRDTFGVDWESDEDIGKQDYYDFCQAAKREIGAIALYGDQAVEEVKK